MRRKIRLSVFIFMFSLGLFVSGLCADTQLPLSGTEPTISMDFQDANLKDLLKILSMQSGLNFIASEAVQNRAITLYLDKVPLSKAMDKLFRANNLSYELDEEANIFTVKDWGRPQIETVTKVFHLKYATVSSSSLKEELSNYMMTAEKSATGEGGGGESGRWKSEENVGITEVVKKMLSEYGSVVEDFRTNSLVVTDIPSRIPIIAQTIAALDIPAPQVILEVEILDVSKNKVDRMGINWASAGSYSIKLLSASRGTDFPLSGFSSADSRAGTGVSSGTLSFPTSLQIILDFLRTQTDTKYLARPRLLTLNNETAEIKIVTQESIGIKTSTSATEGISTQTVEPERVETGVSLRVTPQISIDTGEITMVIFPQVTEALSGNQFTSGGDTYQYRDPEIRGTKSIVRIKDGETVIIGGLIRNEFLQTNTKIPILGDLPLIGALFRHRGGGSASSSGSDKDKERELLVFITPHIVRDTVGLTQAKKVTLPEREQNTASGISRELTVATSLNNFEKRKK